MPSDSEDSIQYTPYNKEIVKQKSKEYYNKNKEIIERKAREYYYKNKEKVLARQKISTIYYHLKKKRNDPNIIKNGLKINQLKSNKN